MNSSKPLKRKRHPSINKTEWTRLLHLKSHEDAARREGFSVIAGVDEAGRGPLAGPVVAAACVIPEDLFISGINDSKQLSPKQRHVLFERLTTCPDVYYGIGIVNNNEIDRINILQATIQAMLIAISQLEKKPDKLLVDGMDLPQASIPCQKIFQGDAHSYCIAAASILAKETRDRLMCDYHKEWPEYGFNQHKGYGTELHLSAIAKHGPCSLHRMTFSPLRSTREAQQLSFMTELLFEPVPVPACVPD